MIINNVPFSASLLEILKELQLQLASAEIPLLKIMRDTPDNVMVCCPYHSGGQEKRPSAGIKKSDGTFHCFACGEVHTLPEMITYCFGQNDVLGVYGWNWLLKNFASVDVENRRGIELDLSRDKHQTVTYVSEEELDSYRNYHPYMWKRKMTPEVVEIFDIGYDIKTECITFPVRDITGNTLFVARRSVKTKFFNYPSGAEKPVYGLYELSTLKEFPQEVIICESMIDAITCWVYGKYAVALNGLGNDLQFKQLNSMPCRKFILATDNDDAGMKARVRLHKNIKRKLVTEYILPSGKKDINDLDEKDFKNLKEVFYTA